MMKKRFFMAALSIACATCCSLGAIMVNAETNSVQPTNVKTIDMYLIAGQSNAAGTSKHGNNLTETFKGIGYAGEANKNRSTGIAESSNVAAFEDFVWEVKSGYGANASQIGPEYGMAKALSAYYSEENPAFIFKSAAGDTSLRDYKSNGSDTFGNWYPRSLWANGFTPGSNSPTGLQYYNFITNFEKVYDELVENGYTPKVKGLFWMQGCADLGVPNEYEILLETLIGDMRSDLKDITGDDSLDFMPFIIGKIATSVKQYNNPQVPPFNEMQQRVADKIPAVATVNTSDLIVVKQDGTTSNWTDTGGGDYWHFGYNDMVTLGTRVAGKIIEVNNSDGVYINVTGEGNVSHSISGNNVTLTITPATGYMLSALVVNGVNVTAQVASNQYTFAKTDYVAVNAIFRSDGQTSTWTDPTTGTKYTFEGDINTFTTTDIGDLDTPYKNAFATEEGLSGSATSGWAEDNKDALIYLTDQAWTKKTGGIHFKFETDNEWYRPAHTTNTGSAVSAAETGRIEIFYGDLRIYIERHNDTYNGKPRSNAKIGALATRTDLATTDLVARSDMSNVSVSQINWNWFTYNVTDGNHYQNGWSEMKISKYECTAIDGDGSAAKGYWLKIAFTKPGQETFTGAVNVFNGYIPNAMYTDKYDCFVIRNATMETAVRDKYTITDPNYENYDCKLSVKRGDGQVAAKWDEETYKDVAEFAGTDSYMQGVVGSSVVRYYNGNDMMLAGMDASVGLEMRGRHLNNSFLSPNTGKTNSVEYGFMSAYVGGSFLLLNYDRASKNLAVFGYNLCSGYTFAQVNGYRYSYDLGTGEDDQEYVWRITRIAARPIDGTDDGKGGLIRLYLGKIDPTTNMPEEGWDDAPIFEAFDPSYRYFTNVSESKQGLGITHNNVQDGNKFGYTMRWISNKYVAVTTNVNEHKTIYKVVRGDDFTFTPVVENDTIHVGWSRGAQTYSTEDFLPVDGTVENVYENVEFKALTMQLKADKTASLRFRKRGDTLPLEVSLRWNVEGIDENNLAYYFGNFAFGYKLTVDMKTPNDTSDDRWTEGYVSNFTNGFEEPYQYSITQSNIGADYYTMKFVCQAFVEFEINGVKTKFYTELPSLLDNGRSVAYVAEMAVNDARDTATMVGNVAYTNAITTENGTKYHYLTQKQYNLLKNIIHANV